MKKCWITLLSSEDYLEAVLALNNSLRMVSSGYPLIAAVTDVIFENKEICDILQHEHIIVEYIKSYSYSEKTLQISREKKHDESVLNTASKIGIFDLKHYDKLVYIDADTFFMKNSDELFDYPDGAMCLDPNLINGLIWGFTGLFVFCPKNHYTHLYELLLSHGTFYDGDMFGQLWFHIRDNKDYQIPLCYLQPVPQDKKIDNSVKIYHMINPWAKLWKKKYFNNSGIEQHYRRLLFYHRMTYPYFRSH